MTESAGNLDTLVKHVAENPNSLVSLAVLLLAKGQEGRARQLCAQAVALAPEDAEIRALAAEVFSHGVPTWYFSMVRDSVRHKKYEAAFRRAIKPGSRVLDVGSGTGLFAMMAARAGAAEVITCESNPAVAAAVSQVIARNGLADIIRVVAKHSSDLVLGSDLPGPADVIVWDNLTRNLIGAGVLAMLEHAIRRFAHPDTRVIPARGSIRAALADYAQSNPHMENIEGFDLSPFKYLAPPYYRIDRTEKLPLRSDAADILAFDFESGGPFPQTKTQVLLSSQGGSVSGVAQWISLELDEGARYENAPPLGWTESLGILFYPFADAIDTAPGDQIRVCGSHDRNTVRIWLSEGPL